MVIIGSEDIQKKQKCHFDLLFALQGNRFSLTRVPNLGYFTAGKWAFNKT